MRELRSPILQRVLTHELERGNEVGELQRGWSRMDIVIQMVRPLDVHFAKQLAAEEPKAHTFQTGDPHYQGAAFGISCGAEAITGPAGRNEENSRSQSAIEQCRKTPGFSYGDLRRRRV